jgi:methyl-accepting chemotaxis protein
VDNGNIATRKGEVIVNLVNESFEQIRLSFRDIDGYITKEQKKIVNTAALFSNIRVEAESIARISEEHAASTEEILATTEEHNASIKNIYNLMQDIKISSDNLQHLIKNPDK